MLYVVTQLTTRPVLKPCCREKNLTIKNLNSETQKFETQNHNYIYQLYSIGYAV